ncbi:MAG: hypothetical protein OSB42_12975 [Planctomycetota bacterium]|nr:hypothetical protein [Planctomycetota bacterium]
MPLRHLLRILGDEPKESRPLTKEEAFRAMTSILSGGESEITVGAFLIALRWKGVTVEELTGFALAARGVARIPCQGMEGLVCVCPPHDGQVHHPPLDALSSLIAAGAGARVLMITDQGVPPLRGLTAPNILEGLGLQMTWDPTEAEDWVAKGRFAVLSATGMLPGLLHTRRARKGVVLRTPLSTLEKLLAPSHASVVLGAMHGPVLGTAVEVIQGLGHPRGTALQGVDGGVVPWVSRRTRGIALDGGHLVPLVVDPTDFGLGHDSEPELPMYGPPEEEEGACDNPQLIKDAQKVCDEVLKGVRNSARDAALMGAGVILKTVGLSMTLAEGVDLASQALDGGAVTERIAHLGDLSHQ